MKRAAGVLFAAFLSCIIQGCSQSECAHTSRSATVPAASASQAGIHHAFLHGHRRYAMRTHTGYIYAERAYNSRAFRAGKRYAQSFYDYHSSSRVTSLSQEEFGYAASRYESGQGFSTATPGGPAIVYPEDFSGGVSSGVDGVNGSVWIDGYGRRHLRHNSRHHFNSGSGARLRAWHGYNFEDGLSNGY